MKLNVHALLFEIPTLDSMKQNPRILRIILSHESTRIDFGYTTPWYYSKGGWIKISPNAHLQVQGSDKKYQLKEAIGIPIAPERTDFESTKDWQFFSLIFDPIPKTDCFVHMVEVEKPTPNDFNYNGIELKMARGLEVF